MFCDSLHAWLLPQARLTRSIFKKDNCRRLPSCGFFNNKKTIAFCLRTLCCCCCSSSSLIKLHKKPYKARFIATSGSCRTTELSKLLPSCLNTIKKTRFKYCERVYVKSGKNPFGQSKLHVRYQIS